MKGTASKVDRKKGYAYRAVIDLPGDQRKQKTRAFWSEKYDNPKDAADAWLISMNQKLHNGETFHDKEIAFESFAKVWQTETEDKVRESTAKKRERHIRNHLIPYFEDRKLSDITSFCVSQFYKDKLDDLSPSSVRSLHTILNLILGSAEKQGFIEDNPAAGIDPPTVYSPEFTVYDREQINLFLMNLRKWEDEQDRGPHGITYSMYPLFYTLFHTGLRVGEILGLRLEDVDLSSGSIDVKVSLDKTGGLSLEKPKTESSIRTVAITEKNCSVLKDQMKQRDRLRYEAGEWSEAPTVFVTSTGSMMWPSTPRRRLNKVLDNSPGLPDITMNEMRHTHATLLLRSGVDTFSASKRLGHSSIKTTEQTYAKYVPSMQKETVDKYQETLNF